MRAVDPFHAVSHVSVLHVLPVHQHVVPTQRPHLALARHHVALEHIVAVSVHMRRKHGVDAVLREAGDGLSGRRGTGREGEP